ncbi:MAG: CHAT domain-containing protein [Candidatus Acidiferrales bacterium]
MIETQVAAEKLFDELAKLEDQQSLQKFLDLHPSLVRAEVVTWISEAVVRRIRVDTRECIHLADAAVEIAHRVGQEECLAFSLRAKANALHGIGENRTAVEHHERAFRIFESLEEWNEAARTLSASIQPLILLGEYDRAFAVGDRAREIFTRLNLPWRLARLEINVGNIFHRQERFEEAQTHYERAYEGLLSHHDAEGMGVVLSNMAVCLISLNDFPRALKAHERARAVCEENGMALLVAQADYNIAYLYYLRGEYSRAIEMLYAARRACEATGDAYHHALCYLDLSEIYLELNLSEEAREMAHEGFQRFEQLGMAYEAAKTLANQAMALGQQGRTAQALELFLKSRQMFAQEKNVVWPSLLDLYQALLLFREGRHFEARRLCVNAAEYFDHTALTSKAALSHLLLGRIALQMGDGKDARRETDCALGKLAGLEAPVLAHQAHFLSGQVHQSSGDAEAAYAAFQEARKALETLRSLLHGEELKISFAKNRLEVYEALVLLCLRGEINREVSTEAFGYMEAAKSRSMIEKILPGNRSSPSGDSGQSGLVRRVRDLREELNWYYHRIELEQLRPEEPSPERIRQLQKQAQAREHELLRELRELPANEREGAALEAHAVVSLANLQASLPENAALIEYYSAGDRVFAAVVTRADIQIVPVTVLSRIANSLDLLRFQLGKFRLGTEYVQRFAEPLLRATNAHLESLYSELLAPLRPLLQGDQLIFVPHGPLHYLPFHALRNGGEHLCDAFKISYAPSATVFAHCQARAASAKRASLIFGIPDERAPQILPEVQSVASILTEPQLYIGARATAAVLREKGPESGVIHIATHGLYRQDNPMFSCIRLGDGYLNLYDLYQMRLDSSMIALSGCATGMNVVAAGDELLGLQRGLFAAGATSLLLSLWDVYDRTTAELMKSIYQYLTQSGNIDSALQAAMKDLRARFPHPYFWAPFIHIGKLTESKSLN